MNNSPRSNRLHIAILGIRNSGKSSLINALTAQETSIVSDVPGTTTDLVYKNMEIAGIGPVTWIDTPGFDDDDEELGALRVAQVGKALDKTDIVILMEGGDEFLPQLRKRNIPIVRAAMGQDRESLIEEIRKTAESLQSEADILGNRVQAGDLVLLVMPQDPQAPKGRLILPQSQTIRELMEKHCISVCCTPEQLPATLQTLSSPPRLIITDSQVFNDVYRLKPKESLLTSFSILFAAYKGELETLKAGARMIDQLSPESRVLIAEGCTHAPLSEDIGRVKIPRLLRKRIGEELSVEMIAGNDFPNDLSSFDLVIHCGACMLNRRHMMNRIRQASEQNVPITNYGITIAYLNGLFDRIDW